MAKRAAPDEKPYRPLLDTDLMNAALTQVVSNAQPHTAPTKVVDLPRSEPPKRFEASRPIPQPSVQRQLDPELRAPSPAPFAEKFDQEKRILFTRSETQAIDRLVTSLAMRLNSQVKVSHLMRALVALLLNAEADVHKRAGEAGPVIRPPNGDAQALQRFEKQIAGIIGSALTDAGPLR
jgi:hypothetical protein